MSKQFNVYLIPKDAENLIYEVKERLGCSIITTKSSSPNAMELGSPVQYFSDRLNSPNSCRLDCYLAPSCEADIRFRYFPTLNQWLVDDKSEVVEFRGCDFDGEMLYIGRLYFQTDFLIEDTIWRKRPEFLSWADKVFRISKNILRRSKELDAYLGEGTEKWRREGGHFISMRRADGTPVYAGR